MKYDQYLPEDFAADPAFIRWVKDADPENRRFWERWQREHPEKKVTLEEARQLVRLVHFETVQPTSQQIESLWNTITAGNAQRQEQNVRPLYWGHAWQKVAAAVTLLLVALGTWWVVRNMTSKTEYRTAYGEIKTITLPDQSVVTLNANSTLTLVKDWEETQKREVWLEGEAFFKVSKMRRDGKRVKFAVHSREVEVEVLGTEFNVNNRHRQTEVVLRSGKVQLRQESQLLLMQPGDRVVFSETRQQFDRQRVNAQLYHSWTRKELVFRDTPLRQIAQTIQDQFGMKVELADTATANIQFSGTLPSDNLEVMRTALSHSLEVDIVQKGSQMYIRPKTKETQ